MRPAFRPIRAAKLTALVLIPLCTAPPAAGCDMDCYTGCVSKCEALCDQSKDCTAVVMTYVPGAGADSGSVGSRQRGAVVGQPLYGSYQCGFVSCTHNQSWNGETYKKLSTGHYEELPGTIITCPKNATVPTLPSGKQLTVTPCVDPAGGPTSNCKPADLKRKRHNTLWLPGAPANTTAADIVAMLTKHEGAYDTISMPWAWWNSKWNVKCNNDTAGLCGRGYSAFSQAVADGLKGKNFRFVPMLQVCAVCVLNGTWDWKPAMELLIEDAKQNNFSGYSLDMEMGGAFNQSGRATFLTTFSDMVHTLGPDTETQWFSHWRWWPDLSMPNTADFLVCMDSYGPNVEYFADYWLKTYGCKASVGLEYPGDALPAMQKFFPDIVNSASFRSIGTWGAPEDDGSPMASLWWTSLKQFLAADTVAE